MDAYRNDLASARKRFDQLETALADAQAQIARLETPQALRGDRPLERRLSFALGLGLMLTAAAVVQLVRPAERTRTVIAPSLHRWVPPPSPVPPLDVGASGLDGDTPRTLRPEDERQLADPVKLPRIASAASGDETEIAFYEPTGSGDEAVRTQATPAWRA